MKKSKINIRAILTLLTIGSSIYLMRSISLFTKVETFIRYLIIALMVIFDIFTIYIVIKNTKERKKKKKKSYNILLIILTILYIFLAFNLNKIYSYISKTNKNVTYSISMVTRNDESVPDLITIKKAKLGIITDEGSDNKEYTLSKKIINNYKLSENNELVTYDNYTMMITDLLDKEIDYAFLPTNYADIYSTTEGFETLGEKLKTITSESMEETKEEAQLLGSSKDLTEPFTILLIGIDSTTDGLKQADSFNGDSLMLVTFDPKTMNATMLSIPRDSYVPIACFKRKYENKITHAASRGTSCVINTIQDFLDVKIDYYVKINFLGLVELVDAVDGIDIDVPYSFCEQDSQRRFGDHIIYVKKGYQTLNGEQALAFSRNRKKNSEYCSKEWTEGRRDDFVRGTHQQMVVEAILTKLKSFSNVNKIDEILQAISNNLDTNMTENTILSFYNVAKDVMFSSSNDDVLTIQKLYIEGTGQTIYDENTRLQLWNYIPNKQSVNDVKDAMKINLWQKEHEVIKTFTYSIKDGYEEKIIGKGPYKVYTTYDLLPDLTKRTLSEAKTWATKNKITLNIEYEENTRYKDDKIIKQNYPVNKRLDKIDNKTVTITVIKNKKQEQTTTKIDCLEEENNKLCILPDFTNKKKSDVITWGNKFSNEIAIRFEYKDTTDKEKDGLIEKQSVEKETKVKEILEKKETINFVILKFKEQVTSEKEENDNNS